MFACWRKRIEEKRSAPNSDGILVRSGQVSYHRNWLTASSVNYDRIKPNYLHLIGERVRLHVLRHAVDSLGVLRDISGPQGIRIPIRIIPIFTMHVCVWVRKCASIWMRCGWVLASMHDFKTMSAELQMACLFKYHTYSLTHTNLCGKDISDLQFGRQEPTKNCIDKDGVRSNKNSQRLSTHLIVCSLSPKVLIITSGIRALRNVLSECRAFISSKWSAKRMTYRHFAKNCSL